MPFPVAVISVISTCFHVWLHIQSIHIKTTVPYFIISGVIHLRPLVFPILNYFLPFSVSSSFSFVDFYSHTSHFYFPLHCHSSQLWNDSFYISDPSLSLIAPFTLLYSKCHFFLPYLFLNFFCSSWKMFPWLETGKKPCLLLNYLYKWCSSRILLQ